LVNIGAHGEVELCDVAEGETVAIARFAARPGPSPRGYFVGGDRIPPAVVLTVGYDRLVAIDLRTGQLRWEFSGQGTGPLRITRAGRALLVASQHAVDALDVASGEVVWRFTTPHRLCHEPLVHRDMVVVTKSATELGSRAGGVFGIDLFTGEERWFKGFDAS